MAVIKTALWKRGESDGWVWEKDSVYTVRYGYNALANDGTQRNVYIFEEL